MPLFRGADPSLAVEDGLHAIERHLTKTHNAAALMWEEPNPRVLILARSQLLRSTVKPIANRRFQNTLATARRDSRRNSRISNRPQRAAIGAPRDTLASAEPPNYYRQSTCHHLISSIDLELCVR